MCDYIVRDGDTIESISLNMGVPQSVLRDLNNIVSDDSIQPGKSLKIWEPLYFNDNMLEKYKVKNGDTLSKIAQMYHCDYRLIQTINDIPDANKINAGDTLYILTLENAQKNLDEFIEPQSQSLLEVIEAQMKRNEDNTTLMDVINELLNLASYASLKAAIIQILKFLIEGDYESVMQCLLLLGIEDVILKRRLAKVITFLIFFAMPYKKALWLIRLLEFLISFIADKALDAVYELFK